MAFVLKRKMVSQDDFVKNSKFRRKQEKKERNSILLFVGYSYGIGLVIFYGGYF